jgi:hypothetical protein
MGEGELLFLLSPLCATPNPLTKNRKMKKINEDKMTFMQDILGIQTEMGVEMLRAACECVQLFDSKQLDYGSSNIALGAELGVAVRLQDKVSRMRNLLLKELKGDKNVNHESLEDSFKDAANYGMIGLLLKRGLWK